MKMITREEKLESLERGIRLENLKINKLREKLKDAELCRQVEINRDIELCKMIIQNAEDRIEYLNLVW